MVRLVVGGNIVLDMAVLLEFLPGTGHGLYLSWLHGGGLGRRFSSLCLSPSLNPPSSTVYSLNSHAHRSLQPRVCPAGLYAIFNWSMQLRLPHFGGQSPQFISTVAAPIRWAEHPTPRHPMKVASASTPCTLGRPSTCIERHGMNDRLPFFFF